MGWIYRSKYAGPDRRSDGFTVRFVERRKESETAPAPVNALRELFSRGLRWVDHLNYFGPDRRGDDFSFYFFERRRTKSAGKPPPLRTALRQLRVRVANADGVEGQDALRERLTATALLAEAQGFASVAAALTTLARSLEHPFDEGGDPRPELHIELNRVESMLA